jgi:hypothetical protein
MSAPLISVIMPVHNAASYVGDAIRSVLAQTEGDFELVLVNDASTDRSAEVIADLRDDRLRCRHSSIPLNAAGARNLALAEARGDFVAFLDADDLARPDRFAIQLDVLRSQPEVSVVGSLIEAIDENGCARGSGFVRAVRGEEIPATLLFENGLALSSVMARRAVLSPFRPEFAPAEDYDLWARLAVEARFAIIPQQLTSYRTHPASVSFRQAEQMRAAVKRVHAWQLARLGMEPLAIHELLTAWPLQPSWDQLHAAEKWLCGMAEANASACIYSRHALRRVLAGRWWRVCMDSWALGWPVWRAFHRSSLAAPTIAQSLRLFRRLAPRIFRP